MTLVLLGDIPCADAGPLQAHRVLFCPAHQAPACPEGTGLSLSSRLFSLEVAGCNQSGEAVTDGSAQATRKVPKLQHFRGGVSHASRGT